MSKANATVRRLMIALNVIDNTYIFDMARLAENESELWLLYAIDDGEPHSQKSICEEWGFSYTTLNTTVKKLEQTGMLVQQPIPGKRREKHIFLTDTGKEYAGRILDFVYEAENRAIEETLASFSPEFVDALELFGRTLKDTVNRQREEGKTT